MPAEPFGSKLGLPNLAWPLASRPAPRDPLLASDDCAARHGATSLIGMHYQPRLLSYVVTLLITQGSLVCKKISAPLVWAVVCLLGANSQKHCPEGHVRAIQTKA